MSTPQLSKKKADPPKKPSTAEFAEYCEKREARKALERDAAELKKREDELGKAIEAYAVYAGGKERTVECCGHRASITTQPAAPVSVAWACVRAFKEKLGQAAYDLVKSRTPDRDVLSVEKL